VSDQVIPHGNQIPTGRTSAVDAVLQETTVRLDADHVIDRCGPRRMSRRVQVARVLATSVEGKAAVGRCGSTSPTL
jgi:hypothetical protein